MDEVEVGWDADHCYEIGLRPSKERNSRFLRILRRYFAVTEVHSSVISGRCLAEAVGVTSNGRPSPETSPNGQTLEASHESAGNIDQESKPVFGVALRIIYILQELVQLSHMVAKSRNPKMPCALAMRTPVLMQPSNAR